MRFTLKNLVARLARDERGATLVEYGVAVVLAVIVGTGGLLVLAGQIDGNMGDAQASMAPAGTAGGDAVGDFTTNTVSFADTTDN